jgi:methyl-accepting chemotaxis protein
MEDMEAFSLSPEELGIFEEMGRTWSALLAGAERIFAIEDPVGNEQAQSELSSLQPMAERLSAFAQGLHAEEMKDVRLSRESADAITARTSIFLVAAVALAIGVSILLSQVIARAIGRPIVRLTDQATAISLGELDTRVEVNSRGEVGELAQALERMRTSLKMTIDRLSEEEEDLRSWTAHLVDRELRRKVRGGTIALGGQRYEVGHDLDGQAVYVRLDLDLREIVVTPTSGPPRRLPLRS